MLFRSVCVSFDTLKACFKAKNAYFDYGHKNEQLIVETQQILKKAMKENFKI